MAKAYWLMKSEPSEFGIDHLAKKKTALWDGVRNYQVRNMFRDVMKVGDAALFYHSNTKDIGVIGEMVVVEPAKPDPTQFVRGHKYFDEKSLPENPRWLGPVVEFVRKFPRTVALHELKSNDIFSDVAFIQKGNRLSVCQISREQYLMISRLAQKKM